MEFFLLLVFGFLSLSLAFLQFKSFQWLGSPFPTKPLLQYSMLVAGLLLSAFGLYCLPPAEPRGSLGRWPAYGILAVVLGVGAFFRLYRLNQPFEGYWDDYSMIILDSRRILDYHQFKIFYSEGFREPLYTYLAAGVWGLFPSLPAVGAARLTSALIDLAAVVVFYLLGKEISGRRQVGLLLAAFGAVSKPMLIQEIMGTPGVMLPLSAGLYLLFQIRLLRKPSLARFLQWGVLMGVTAYTYGIVRPWLLFLPLLTLGWILWRQRNEKIRWVLRAGLALFCLGYFAFLLDRMFGIFHENPLSGLWGGHWAVFLLLQGAFAALFIRACRSSQGKEYELCSWALGLLCAGLLIYPLANCPNILHKIEAHSLFSGPSPECREPNLILRLVYQFANTWKALFVGGEASMDRGDMNVPADAFFDYHASVLAAFGLVYAVIRPSRTKVFLLLCALVGMAPRYLTNDPHTGKIVCALPALLLLASLALDHWIQAAWSGPWRTRWRGLLLVTALACFWAWEAQGTYARVFENWWYIPHNDVQVFREAAKDLPDKRVYLRLPPNEIWFFSTKSQSILHDGVKEPLYLLQNSNPIPLLAGEARRDVVVFVSPQDKQEIEKLKADFPAAQWTPVWRDQPKTGEGPLMLRMLLPASQIPEKPGKTLYYQPAQAHTWLRRVYSDEFGLRQGLVLLEDRSDRLNPFPQGRGETISAEGETEVPADGKYNFSLTGPDVVQLWIDGRLAVDFKPREKGRKFSKTLFLAKGPHSIKYLAYVDIQYGFTDIVVRNKDLNYQATLGEPDAPDLKSN
jgi:hypothetical protein